MTSHGQQFQVWCPTCGDEYPPDADFCPEDGTRLRDIHRSGAAETADTDPFVGRRLGGRFTIDGPLGSGGMATVYRATQHSVDRPVAVKILRSDLTERQQAQKRFFREAEAISTFNHPNIVNLIDFGRTEDEGALYLVMELIEGRSLAELVETGRLAPPLAIHVARQLSGALAEVHAHDIVHRDLKPGNVMILAIADGQVQTKLVDFGIAHALRGATTLTESGAVCGTPFYMAPEQAIGADDIGPAVDLYALGVMLYEMLTGRAPFRGDSALEVMYAHAHRQPRPVAAGVPDGELPDDLAALVHELLRKRPSDRPARALDVRDRLEAIAQAERYDPVRVAPNDGDTDLVATWVQDRLESVSPGSSAEFPETARTGASAYETGDDLSDALAPTREAGDGSPWAESPETGGGDEPAPRRDAARDASTRQTRFQGATGLWALAIVGLAAGVAGGWWLATGAAESSDREARRLVAGGGTSDSGEVDADASSVPEDVDPPDLPDPRLVWAGEEDRRKANRLNARGLDLHARGNFREAAVAYRDSIRADPSYLYPRYNLACALARSNRPRSALSLLAELEAFGTSFAYERLARARSDADFESLHDDPRFRRLTSEAEVKIADDETAARRLADAIGRDDTDRAYEFLARDAHTSIVVYPRLVDTRITNTEPVRHYLSPSRLVTWLEYAASRPARAAGFESSEALECRDDCCSVDDRAGTAAPGLSLRKVCFDRTDGGHPEISSVSIVARYSVSPPDSIDRVAELVPSPAGTPVLLVGDYGTVAEVRHASFTGFRERDIWSFEPGDPSLEQLTDDRTSLDPDWAPDGRRFAFVESRGLAIYDLEQGEARTLREAELPADPRGEYDLFLYSEPRWGARGRFLAANGTDTGVNYGLLYDIDYDCSVLRARSRRLTWSPEGDLIVTGPDGDYRRVISGEKLESEGCPSLDLARER